MQKEKIRKVKLVDISILEKRLKSEIRNLRKSELEDVKSELYNSAKYNATCQDELKIVLKLITELKTTDKISKK